ncbi:CapA family protein [Candidatus Kaiserbacteria bacterium]|nr:CapA family protein [Candidatus Kaiserbacteria bacterium]
MSRDLFLSLLAVVGLCVFVTPALGSTSLPALTLGALTDDIEEGSAIFVGDLMLGRHIETLSNDLGYEYFFEGIRERVAKADLAVGNFEGALSTPHVHTPDFGMRLSIPEEAFSALAETGFDVLSLANNHSFDYGEEGYREAHVACAKAGLRCSGNPERADGFSTTVAVVGDVRMGLIMLHSTDTKTAQVDIEHALAALTGISDVQVLFVHWGNEYELGHSAFQEVVAHAAIDAGVDLVVGHHPHVVQDVELYQGKLIVYSLGNFIFDQYFSDAVEEGLLLELAVSSQGFTYTLVPLDLKTVRSSPRPMAQKDSEALLSRIIPKDVKAAIVEGEATITLPY